MTETVLVTGGTGYVAGWCIVELLERGYRVRATVRTAARADAVHRAVATVADPDDRLEVAVADLTADEGWKQAATGCDHVLHVASPMGLRHGDDVAALVGPARDGTLRVLRAATEAGVQRVVMTSAANAASPSSYREEGVSDESVWTDPDDPTLWAYRRAKTVAERAAWDFMASHGGPTSLTTILPGAVFGPPLTAEHLGSVQIVRRLLRGMPGTPRIGFEIVDVRDIASLHVSALSAPVAAGQRFLATGEFRWMSEMAATLRAGLGEAAARVPTRELPDVAVRLVALFDRSLREITPSLGRRHRHSTEKARRLFDWQPRPAEETVLDCARALINLGAV